MEITSLRFADAVVVSVVGKIDFASSPRFDEALTPLLKPSADGPGAIVVDFAGVHFISSPGLRLLMIAAKAMHARKAAFAVASLDPFVDAVVRVTGFNELFRVFPSVRDALRSLSGPALAAYERATDPPLA